MNFNELFQKMRELDQPVAEEKQADKDYDDDGEVESGKDEYMGSRMKAAGLDDEEVDEVQDFGIGPGGPREPAGPISAGPDRIPNTGAPDKQNYKAPLSDKYGWKPGSAAGGWDAAGQQKYIDRTAPGVINKIKDKLGYDMPDTDYGPRPDERERLIKRYPAPVQEAEVDECGLPGMSDMPSGMMGMRSPPQQDSISASVSMNASGTGGIRDLMSILRNIENGKGAHGDEHDMAIAISRMDEPEPLIGMEEAEAGGFDQASTTPNPQTAPMSAAIPTGNDMHSKGGNERPKVNGGGNPYALAAESLIPRLSSLYQEVKSR
jgi:hypothetical protein